MTLVATELEKSLARWHTIAPGGPEVERLDTVLYALGNNKLKRGVSGEEVGQAEYDLLKTSRFFAEAEKILDSGAGDGAE